VRSIPLNRLLAWLVDWLVILVWVGVVASVGVPLYLAGMTRGLPIVALNFVSFGALALPVTIGLALLESSPRRASIGKRIRRLAVVRATTGARVSFRRALGRNALKVALPWTIGHIAVYGIVSSAPAGSVPPLIAAITALAYAVPILWVVSLFIGAGVTPYDRVCGTSVVSSAMAGGDRPW
jgi:hypothetical protein